MKTRFSLFAMAVLTLVITSCTKDNEPSTKVDKSETISLGAGYANDIYYSFKNGVVAETPRASWDIAFSVSTQSSSILINESAGVELKVYPTTTGWNWVTPIDIANYASWTSLRNSNTSWEDGAFSQNATGHPNYGWGVYDMASHNIDGVALFIIKLRNGTYKKIWIEKKYSALQRYAFRYADINGTNEQVITSMSLSDSKANFVYYSLQENLRVDREPDASTWDILFTKWEDVNSNSPYMVTGVLQNIGIKAIDLTVDNPANITYTEDQFSEDINTIGYDWKSFNMNTMLYEVPSNRIYIVKDIEDRVFKISFTGFVGSSTGVLSFDIKEL